MGALRLKNTVDKYEIYGGIRGSISSTVSFNAQVSQKRVIDMPMYLNDTVYSIENRFNVDLRCGSCIEIRRSNFLSQ